VNPPARRRRVSLVTALFGRMGLLLLVLVVSVGAIAYFTAQRRVDEVYDGQLIIGANVLRTLMNEELHETPGQAGGALEIDDSVLSPDDRRAFNDFAEWRMFRIWKHGAVVMRSDTGPPMGGPPATDGFSTVTAPDGEPWRIYSLRVPGHTGVVQVGERTDIRSVLVSRIAIGTALPLLLLIPLAAALLWASLSDGLGAFRLLVYEIGRRTMRDLSPMPLEPWPSDLHPLVRSINRLLERIERSLQHERNFLDNAAHQLRTPLAAVKLQAQLVAQETDPQERRLLIARLSESVDRAAAMTDALLTLARLEMRAGAGQAGDLRAETVAALADLAPLAARRGIELAFSSPDEAPAGDPVLLRLLASNLIENALKHAPKDTEVSVQVVRDDDGELELTVNDHGPGIPPEERKKVLERFYRRSGETEAGSGLGLSIVAEAVRLLNGELILSERADGSPGLSASVRLPAA
jgi:signal transduction histidine kinase